MSVTSFMLWVDPSFNIDYFLYPNVYFIENIKCLDS